MTAHRGKVKRDAKWKDVAAKLKHCGQHSMDCDECHMFRKLHPKERES